MVKVGKYFVWVNPYVLATLTAYEIGSYVYENREDLAKKVEIDKVIISKNDLGAVELANLKRFEKKLPSSDGTIIEKLANGNIVFKSEIPGNVPGSKAVYEKVINPQGETIKYYKTTYAPDGTIVHVKDKFNKVIED